MADGGIGGLIVLIILAFAVYKIVKYIRKRRGTEKDEGIRELTAIMFTDMKDFSKKVGSSEEKTLRKIWKQERIMKKFIEKHKGRLVKTIGDAVMGEFKSAVNAVRCAVDIQDRLLEKDYLVRIGVHLGDVVHRGGDVFGNGVNIAARIESITEPGEIFVSEDVFKQVKGKVESRFIGVGPKKLKNISEPVKVFRVVHY